MDAIFDRTYRALYGGQRHKSWLASCMPSLGCPGNSRCALASTGASQVANWFVGVIILGGPSGDLQLVTLVALIALARTYGVDLRTDALNSSAQAILMLYPTRPQLLVL